MNLRAYLIPQKFDGIFRGRKTLCASHVDSITRPEFDTPSLALKIGYSLKKCASINGKLKQDEIIRAFLSLLEIEWASRIFSNALNTL
nr:unnamed protein product [Callosobruchus analis]